MSDSIISQGSRLEVQIGGVYTNVAEVSEETGLGGTEANEIDVTHLLSTAKEFKLGLRDEGSASFRGNYVPGDAGQGQVRSLRASQGTGQFRLTFSNGSG